VTKEMPPVDALAAAAENAVAIVVGRHHGEAADGAPVGSTTSRLLNHSPIPVISVPRGYSLPATGRHPRHR
jgi:nucleotide-binding universal stress UspA family protein